ncbi:MAG: B-4DMT family transporter [Haloechinothrix sp.]
MPPWLIRGLTLAVVHAAGHVALAKIGVFRATETTVVTAVVFALLLGMALTWGAIDGWLRRPDQGKTWVIAALIAGPVAGALNVLGRALLVDQTGASELGVQLTSGAAFTALLVLVPAGLGLFVGGRLDSPVHEPAHSAAELKPEPPRPRPLPGRMRPQHAAKRPVGKRPSPTPRAKEPTPADNHPKTEPTG